MTARTFKRPLGLALAIMFGLAAGGTALAAVDAAKVEHDRMENFHKIGKAFKAINDQVKADKPDTALIAGQAGEIKGLAHNIPTWFPAGSGPETGVKTRAKPEIWSDKANFAAAAKGLETEAGKLQTIAAKGNLDAIKAQLKATGEACGTCHKKYRGPELDKDHDGH